MKGSLMNINMKCSAVHLSNRSELNRRKLNRNLQGNLEPVYITKGYHGYSFTFLNSHLPEVRKPPVLSVNNLDLPEDFRTLNTGYSLNKWANKMPRLKSARKSDSPSKNRELDPEYDMSYDINNILDCIDNSENQEFLENNHPEEYELHSDIEELIRKSAKIRQEEEEERMLRKRKVHSDGRPLTEKDSRRRHKHRLKKTIRFSFSKPASPQTEQVIRVDVTSNISVEEFRQIESSRSDPRSEDRGKNSSKVINDCNRKELDGGFSESGGLKFDGEDEEFIIRCSQLALTQKRR